MAKRGKSVPNGLRYVRTLQYLWPHPSLKTWLRGVRRANESFWIQAESGRSLETPHPRTEAKNVLQSTKRGPGVVARVTRKRTFADREVIHAAYYPRPEHSDAFAARQRLHLVFPAGPTQTRFPGAVGVIQANADHEKKTLEIHNLQGGYKQKTSEEGLRLLAKHEAPPLTRALASKYGGWRQHLLDELFEYANAHGLGKVEWNGEYYDENRHVHCVPRAAARTDFSKIAQKHGFAVETTRNGATAEKRD